MFEPSCTPVHQVELVVTSSLSVVIPLDLLPVSSRSDSSSLVTSFRSAKRRRARHLSHV